MNSPDAFELLTIASETLLSRVLPAVSQDLEYDVRMIAKAMSVSAQELRKGEEIAEAEYQLLSTLIDSNHELSSSEDLRKTVSQQIRTGFYDASGSGRCVLLKALRAITIGQLELSNPKLVDPMKTPR